MSRPSVLRHGSVPGMLATPLQMVLVALAGWLNREQLAVIDYLSAEPSATTIERRHERSIVYWNSTGSA